jgi:hypothetical protein
LNRPSRSPKTDQFLSISDLERYGEGWVLDCKLRQLSPRTVATREDAVKKLLWFLSNKGYSSCGLLELRNYLAYLATGHKEESGRWGNAALTQPLRPRSVWDFHNNLRCFFNWTIWSRWKIYVTSQHTYLHSYRRRDWTRSGAYG